MKQLNFADRQIQLFQNNVRDSVEPLEKNLLLGGTFLQNVILTTGITNIVPTGLNKILSGWIITRNNANSTFWDTQATNPTPSQNLYLHCSANCTVTLYVF